MCQHQSDLVLYASNVADEETPKAPSDLIELIRSDKKAFSRMSGAYVVSAGRRVSNRGQLRPDALTPALRRRSPTLDGVPHGDGVGCRCGSRPSSTVLSSQSRFNPL
jgi:hypothetical protein